MVGWSKIICAVEFSETSRTALEFAAELARRFHADLLLVHVWRGPYPATEESAALPPALTPEEESELERRLEEWERDAEEIGGREVRTVLASGSPAAEVARIASEERADLVVAGSRGRTGFERAVVGSVAEDVVRHSPCSVLVVKAAPDRGD